MRLPRRVLAAAVLAASLAWAPGALRAEPISYAAVGNQGNEWILLIAQAKGFLKANDVELDFVSMPSSAGVMQQVAAGSVNAGDGGFVDPLRAIDKGADIALLRSTAGPPPYQLLARGTIKTLADLRGKTISIGGAQDITRIYLERMLGPAGLPPGSYDLTYAGASSARYAALQSGAVDAAILTSPFNFRGEAAGFTNLGYTADVVQDFPFTGAAVNKTWAAGHKALLLRFLKAYHEAVLWFDDPANHAEAVRLLADASHTDLGDAERTYDFYTRIKAYDPVGALDPQGLGTLLGILKGFGQIEGGADVGRFFDPEISSLAGQVR